MIAVRIGSDMRAAVVDAPSYFAKRPRPKHPQDLPAHACINLRLRTYGSIYAWEFEKNGRKMKVHVEGQLTFNAASGRLTLHHFTQEPRMKRDRRRVLLGYLRSRTDVFAIGHRLMRHCPRADIPATCAAARKGGITAAPGNRARDQED